jgi:hypothetical protein
MCLRRILIKTFPAHEQGRCDVISHRSSADTRRGDGQEQQECRSCSCSCIFKEQTPESRSCWGLPRQRDYGSWRCCRSACSRCRLPQQRLARHDSCGRWACRRGRQQCKLQERHRCSFRRLCSQQNRRRRRRVQSRAPRGQRAFSSRPHSTRA